MYRTVSFHRPAVDTTQLDDTAFQQAPSVHKSRLQYDPGP